MGSLSASAVLQLPVALHGIQLGRPTDILLDLRSWHALGFVVHCRDESERFLPYAACQPGEETIGVGSALMLLEDVSFYEKRGVSFRLLLGGSVEAAAGPSGVLRDLLLGPGGKALELELEVEPDAEAVRVPAAGAVVAPTRASAA